MDDIIEKLSLLDYENAFCRGWKHKRISRVYYAHAPLSDEDELHRIHMLYDMCYWLMSLNKEMVSKRLNFRFLIMNGICIKVDIFCQINFLSLFVNC